MTQAEKQKMMTEAPIPRLVTKMAVPTIVSMLITAFYNMADTFFVGRIESNSATGAVGVVYQLMAIIQATGFFFGHGSGNAISRRLGAKDTGSAEQLAACGFYSALAAGAVIMILGLAFLEPLALALGSTPTILPYAKNYMAVILMGAPYMTAALVLNNQMRFQGNAFFAMIGITSGALLNVALDPLFMFGLGLGIAGAAWATIVSQLVSFVILLIGIRKAGCVPLKLRLVRYWPKQIGEIFRGGFPSLCRQGLSSVSGIFLNRAAGPWGDAAIAAMSVVTRISGFAFSAIIGYGQGFQPVCGFNFGAGKKERVKEAFWFSVKVSTAVLLVTAVAGFLLAPRLIALFRPGDEPVIEIGSLALRFQCVTLPLAAWVTMNNMLFQTCRQTGPASILAMARQGLFFLPAVVILPPFLGLLGVQMAQSVGDVASFLLALAIHKARMPRLLTECDANAGEKKAV